MVVVVVVVVVVVAFHGCFTRAGTRVASVGREQRTNGATVELKNMQNTNNRQHTVTPSARSAHDHTTCLHVHVRPCSEGPDDAGVGGRPPHSLRLQLLDEARLRESEHQVWRL